MRGKRVAVLESRLGAQLAELVAKRGGVPVHAPALAEIPDLDPARIRVLVESLRDKPAKLAVFQTGTGTRALFSATDSLGITEEFKRQLDKSTVAVRGPKPAAALRAQGVRIDRSAAEPFTTREVLLSVADLDLQKSRVLVQRYGKDNTELDRALELAGAAVTEIPTYRWSLPPDTAPLERLVGALERGEIDAALFTNAEQARNLFLIAERQARTDALRVALNRVVVASIGPIASAALREAGVVVGVEASPPKLAALLAALEGALEARGA